jgi:hypothetical protein
MNILGIKAQLDTYDIDTVAETMRVRLSNAQIHADADVGQVRNIEQTLDAIFGTLRLDYARFKSYKSQVERLISITEKVNANGTNEIARKANGTRACSAYVFRETTVNLYDILSNIEYICDMLDGIIDIINKRQDRIITILSVLKLERGLIQ